MTTYVKHNQTLTAIDDALTYARTAEKKRGHLGFSQLCNPDMRTTWLNWRWSFPEDTSPRAFRIFRLGHIIESEIIALVRSIDGVQWLDVDPATGQQFTFSYLGGHVGGSMDGAVHGLPDAPNDWYVGEVKSAKDDSFRQLIKAGSYRAWDEGYFGQLQCYMAASGIPQAMPIVYNKDTSGLYNEIIKPVPGYFENAMINAESLLQMDYPPNSIYKRSSYQVANFKPETYQRIYWGDELPTPNCRNCRHAEVKLDGDARWHCKRWQRDKSVDEQRAGCPMHLYMSCFMPAKELADEGTRVQYQTYDGMVFVNAEDASAHVEGAIYDSQELKAISELDGLNKTFLSDPVPAALRIATDGKLVPQDQWSTGHVNPVTQARTNDLHR